ncbi:hypothetical protein F2P81_022044 [Scophthalmus maximus]|uniref:SAP domain-containing protein n=1 Tax=Scophthalmus maximus TaxID=52904 RepID=A0A6A4RT27_SCOMX|nr:hypothetical protein F2P81_022044 [Scophthalmus maximus]
MPAKRALVWFLILQVAELKQELKLRGLTVSGTKNDLIERLRNYQEQNGGNAAVLKNGMLQPSQQGSHSTRITSTSSPSATATPDFHPGEGGFKLDLSSMGHAVPGRVMRFGSTSSSPPVSPSPSERSLAGMSPDETSCNGDMFGEMVSSPLTQLNLQTSPQPSSNISPLSQSLSTVKEEIQSLCNLSRSSANSNQRPEPLPGAVMETSSVDKDQMLQEKDKQIEELTKMLRQKQRLVETLRSQLEQGKVVVKKEGSEKSKKSPEVKLQTLIKASAIQPPTLPNGTVVNVKKEVESEEEMDGVTEEAQAKKLVTPVFINQQNGTQIQTQAISLDLLKANGTPTLVTDSNGNHYLIALTSPTTDGQNGVSSLAKTNGRITLQRLQSTPSKLPSTDSQSKEQAESDPVSRPIKKSKCVFVFGAQKAGLHLDTNGVPQPSLSATAPPNLQPFFDDMSESESQSSLISSLKENGVNSQQMDDLFDILLKSGEIPGFKANPDPSLAPLHSDPPSPASPPSPLHLSPPTPTPSPLISPQPSGGEPCTGSGRLEDFLESTTGAPLLGVEPDGGLTLIDDLHSQMLSTPSILDHPPSPMDTSDLGFSPHSAVLDFGDPTLDSMDWLDISMVGSTSGGGRGGEGGAGEVIYLLSGDEEEEGGGGGGGGSGEPSEEMEELHGCGVLFSGSSLPWKKPAGGLLRLPLTWLHRETEHRGVHGKDFVLEAKSKSAEQC